MKEMWRWDQCQCNAHGSRDHQWWELWTPISDYLGQCGAAVAKE